MDINWPLCCSVLLQGSFLLDESWHCAEWVLQMQIYEGAWLTWALSVSDLYITHRNVGDPGNEVYSAVELKSEQLKQASHSLLLTPRKVQSNEMDLSSFFFSFCLSHDKKYCGASSPALTCWCVSLHLTFRTSSGFSTPSVNMSWL